MMTLERSNRPPHVVACVFAGVLLLSLGGATTVAAAADDTTASIGVRRCSVATSPTGARHRQIGGSGSVTCKRPYSELALVVCIETSVLATPGSWIPVGCSPPTVAEDASSVGPVAHKVACPALAAYWRTRSVATARNANGNVKFLHTAVAPPTPLGCPNA